MEFYNVALNTLYSQSRLLRDRVFHVYLFNRDYLPGKRHERRSAVHRGATVDQLNNMKFAYDPVQGLLTDEVSGKQFLLKEV